MKELTVQRVLDCFNEFYDSWSKETEYAQFFAPIAEAAQKARDPIVVIVMGESSVGKTTLLQALAGQAFWGENKASIKAFVAKLCYGERELQYLEI